MSAYHYNSEVCLQILYGIAEEIPSGVSAGGIHRGLLVLVRDTIISRTKYLIDWLWTNYQIPQKLKHLEKLEETAGKVEAWRPTTGKVDLNSIIASNLIKRKTELEKHIELLRKESAMITPYITKISEQCKVQLDEISLIEKEF